MHHKNSTNAYIAPCEDIGHCLGYDPDSQDLINSIENRFGVILSNDEAEAVRTPAQLIDLILAKVEHRESTECMSQQAFHLIRRAAQRSFGLQRHSVSPNTKLEDIVPRKLRYARWKGFGTNIGAVSWPELKRSRFTFVALALLAVAGFVFTTVQMPERGLANVLLSLGLAIAFSVGLAWITRPLKRRFPVSCLTVADLVDWIIAENPQLIRHEPNDWTRERVAAAVRRLIIEWSSERDFTEESLFTQPESSPSCR